MNHYNDRQPDDQQLAYRRQVRDAILSLANTLDPDASINPALNLRQFKATEYLTQVTNSPDIAHAIGEALLMLYFRRHGQMAHDAPTIEFDVLPTD